MELVTQTGATIKIGRVERRALDALDVPRPQPPLRIVETWGEITEQVPVLDDVDYQQRLGDWRQRIFLEQWQLIVPALEISGIDMAEAVALHAAGIGDGSPSDALHYTLTYAEQKHIIAAVYYQSTVTARGIIEAEARFGYTWHGQPLSSWSVGYTPGARGQLAADWRAAFRSQLSWSEFCAIPGPEQSAHVAFWALEDRLAYLVGTYGN